MTTSQALGVQPAHDPRWTDDANCRSAEVALFFPTGETGVEAETIRAAKALCRACPVNDTCLQYALETRQTDGIWGGTTERERRRIRRAWVASRAPRAGNAKQVAPTAGVASVPSGPEPDRPIGGLTPVADRPVPRPPWAGAPPRLPSPFISAEQVRRPISR
ncbi:MAG: WhiB family transcriptional regulator, redox-sensing transcriptional regulator [Actinomycetota bacterium]|nr:WhiB family transcriptional regulator, redox-sensing transcriptional regulator [Actinomycetota bacterium]